MVDGAAGPPGVPAQGVKGQEADPVPIRPPAGEEVTALDLRQNESNAGMKKYSTCSKSPTRGKSISFYFIAICELG